MNKRNTHSRVRIIAGHLRHRYIEFPTILSLRPTQDRIRETLFNWLQAEVVGANCLDVFAGSGALGFEALSRGAEHVTFIEQDRQAVESLQHNARTFQLTHFDIMRASVPDRKLNLSRAPYDLVFLDPPFSEGAVKPALSWLIAENAIHQDSLIYFEEDAKMASDITDTSFEYVKKKSTKNVTYGLLRLETGS